MTTGAEAALAAVYGEEAVRDWPEIREGLVAWSAVADGEFTERDYGLLLLPVAPIARDAIIALTVGDVETLADLVRNADGVFSGRASLARTTRLAVAVRTLAQDALAHGERPRGALFDLGALLEFLIAGEDRDAAAEVVADVCALAAALGYTPEDCPIAAMMLMGVESGMTYPGTVNDLVEGE